MIQAQKFTGNHRGKSTALYTLTNKNGLIVQITNFGGKIVSIIVPDRNGNLADITLGYDSVSDYIAGNPFFGAIVGRYANRIAGGKFSIEGIEYQLPVNNGPNSLHGGPEGFFNQVFDADGVVQLPNGETVIMTYKSSDGEEGYPGNLILRVSYTLTENNELILNYTATTDRATHVNICTHPFFNLSGEGKGDILSHELTINADYYTPVDEFQIPTGELSPVSGTPMDFRTPVLVGNRINDNNTQLSYGAGYDHNWVINKNAGELGLAATCYDPISGRVMEIFTTQPGLQFYSGNWLDGSDKGKGGKPYQKRSALCLETQHFPDSPNKPDFPSTLLKPGEVYNHTCVHKFSIK